MQPKAMEDLVAFSAREVKRAAAEERERDEYSSAEGQCESKGGNAIPVSFLKIEGVGDTRWGKRLQRESQIEELVGGQNPGREAPPRSKKRQGSKGDVRVIEGEEIRRDDPVEYFFPTGVGSTS